MQIQYQPITVKAVLPLLVLVMSFSVCTAGPLEKLGFKFVKSEIDAENMNMFKFDTRLKIYSRFANAYICASSEHGLKKLTHRKSFNEAECVWGARKPSSEPDTDFYKEDYKEVYTLVHMTSKNDPFPSNSDNSVWRITLQANQWVLKKTNYTDSAKFIVKRCGASPFIRFRSVEPEPQGQYKYGYYSVNFDESGNLTTPLMADKGCGKASMIDFHYLRNVETLFIPMTVN